MSAGSPPLNPLPAPLAPQYPPLNPIAMIPYEIGGATPSVTLSSSSLVAPNTGITRTVFGGRKRKSKRRNSSRKYRRRHTRSRKHR